MSNSIYPFLASTNRECEPSYSGGKTANAYSSYTGEHLSVVKTGEALSVALVGPDDRSREAMLLALRECDLAEVREYCAYPAGLDEMLKLLDKHYEVFIVDLDSAPEYALGLLERTSAKGVATVMVYSEKTSPENLMRSMRAGAREFLTFPVGQCELDEALGRAVARRNMTAPREKAVGKLLTFMGAKGGVGVTTLACNFAVALAQEKSQSTVIIDLAIPLGDVALNLGVQAEFSTVNALQAADRLDFSFLSSLLVKHSSGLAILAAPGKFIPYQFTNDAVTKLVAVARQNFDYVVVDAGSRLDLTDMSIFKDASTIYLVAQVGIAELRNSNRLISQFFTGSKQKVEIILNRYDTRSTKVPEDYITKVLTRPPGWKIPNDYVSVQRMQVDAIPLVLGNTPIARMIDEMARAVTGKPVPQKKAKGFGLFR